MPRVSEASRIFLGNNAVDRVYAGSNLVWQKPAPLTDQANLFERWMALDAKTGADGDRVPAWAGRVQGLSLVQADDSRRPRVFGSIGSTGVPGILFAGSTLQTASAIAAPPKISVYVRCLFSKPPGSSANSTMFCQDSGGNNRSWHFGVSSTKISRFVNFNLSGSSGQGIELAGTVPMNTWMTIAGVRDGDPAAKGAGTAGAYTSSSGLAAAIANAFPGAVPLTVGSRGAFNEAMNGYIAEVRLYTAAHDAATRAAVIAEMDAAA